MMHLHSKMFWWTFCEALEVIWRRRFAVLFRAVELPA